MELPVERLLAFQPITELGSKALSCDYEVLRRNRDLNWFRVASSALILIVILSTGCSADTDSPQIVESQREPTKPTPVSTIEAKVDEPTPISTIGAKVDEPTPTGQSAPPTPVGSTPTESPSMATHGAPYDGLLSIDKINKFIK